MERVEDILKMIETVDPNDTAKLDEIDTRVWCYLKGYEYIHGGQITNAHKRADIWIKHDNQFGGCNVCFPTWIKYTRSRDALKEIRPEGWTHCIRNRGECWVVEFARLDAKDPFRADMIEVEGLGVTEELAELHAILQAIAYERSQNER